MLIVALASICVSAVFALTAALIFSIGLDQTCTEAINANDATRILFRHT